MRRRVARRIVLITPAERHELAALKEPASPAIWSSRCAPPRSPRGSRAGDAFEARRADRCSRNQCAARRERGTQGLSVLVAEDNEINALLARALLTRLGHRPTIAGERRSGGRMPGSRRARPARPTISC